MTANDILNANDRKVIAVKVPEWDTTVYLRSISAIDRDRYEESILDNSGKIISRVNHKARLLVYQLCDESGTLLFSPDQAEALGQKNIVVIERLYEQALKLSAMTQADVEELQKN